MLVAQAPSQVFDQFLTTYVPETSVVAFVINLVLTAVLSALLGWFYGKFGRSLSNRHTFARNFLMIGMTTMMIISVVKSSLALSLGLVGALSIVRFRTAVKEPEELGYLFLTIAIGLGFGAGHRTITIVAFLAILGVLWIRRRKVDVQMDNTMFVTLSSTAGQDTRIDELAAMLGSFCSSVRLRRLDDSNGKLEVLLEIGMADCEALENARRTLREFDDSMQMTFLQAPEIA